MLEVLVTQEENQYGNRLFVAEYIVSAYEDCMNTLFEELALDSWVVDSGATCHIISHRERSSTTRENAVSKRHLRCEVDATCRMTSHREGCSQL